MTTIPGSGNRNKKGTQGRILTLNPLWPHALPGEQSPRERKDEG